MPRATRQGRALDLEPNAASRDLIGAWGMDALGLG